VVFDHKRVLSCNGGGAGITESKPEGWLNLNSKDKYLSYLPLAHMLEKQMVFIALARGAGVGFFQGNVFKLNEDLKELKPNMFVSVPRLYNRFYDLIMKKINGVTGFKKKLVQKAITTKLTNLREDGSVVHKLYDTLIFNKMKNILGGNARLMLSGAAPIAGDVLEMLQICFCSSILQGYGKNRHNLFKS
jgi:long-chain acyl-CoA synthetase